MDILSKLREEFPTFPNKRIQQFHTVIEYATKILELSITFKTSDEDDESAGGYLPPDEDNQGEITVDIEGSGIQILLTLIHEVGHHIDFIKRGINDKEERAYLKYPTSKEMAPCMQYEADIIFFIEEQAIKYAIQLNDYLDLGISKFTLLKDKYVCRLMLQLILKKGFTSYKDRCMIRKIATEKANNELRRLKEDNRLS